MSTNESYGMGQVDAALSPFEQNGVEELSWELVGAEDMVPELESDSENSDLNSYRKTLEWIYNSNVVNYQEHDIQTTEDGVEVGMRINFYNPRKRSDYVAKLESPGYDQDIVDNTQLDRGVPADD